MKNLSNHSGKYIWNGFHLGMLALILLVSAPLLRCEELTGCLNLTPEFKVSAVYIGKCGFWELSDSLVPNVYLTDSYTRQYSFHHSYSSGGYNESGMWEEDATYANVCTRAGDYTVSQTGGTVTNNLHRWTDGSLPPGLPTLDEHQPLTNGVAIAETYYSYYYFYNPVYNYYWDYFHEIPSFHVGPSVTNTITSSTTYVQSSSYSTNDSVTSIDWDFNESHSYSDLYSTEDFLAYSQSQLAVAPLYPSTNVLGSDPIDPPWYLSFNDKHSQYYRDGSWLTDPGVWVGYRWLNSDDYFDQDTYVEMGGAKYRLKFQGEAGATYELKWIERFFPAVWDEDDNFIANGPGVDTIVTETVVANGKPQYTKPHYVQPPTANGYIVLVMPKVTCSSGSCAAGAESIKNSSVDFSINLGRTTDGRSAGRLFIYASTPSGDLATTAALQREMHSFTNDSPDIWASDFPDGSKEIGVPEMIIDVVPLSSYAYQISLYHWADYYYWGSEDNGDPFTVYQVENPDSSGGTSNQLNIIKFSDGSAVTNHYVWSGSDNGWTLTTGNGLRQESKVVTVDSMTGDEVEAITVKDQSNQTVYRENRNYHTYPDPMGNVLVQRTVDPEGVARTTFYQYYTNSEDDGTSFGKLKMFIGDTGSWTRYEYNTNGLLQKEISGFLNASTTASESSCRVLEYDYSPVNSGDTNSLYPTTPRTTIEKLLGQEISRKYCVLLPGERRDIQCTTPGASVGDSNNLVTITRSYTEGDERVLGRTFLVDYPDGTREVDFYDFYDGYDDDSYADISYVTNTVLRGSSDPSSETNVLDGTRSIIVTTYAGQPVSKAVYDIATGIMINEEVQSDFDAYGRPQLTTYLDGTHTENSYSCCGIGSVVGRDGSAVSYEYDALKRRIAEYHILADSNVLSRHFICDPMGNILSTTRIGTDSSVITNDTSVYDLAGQLIASANALSKTTLYTNYFDGDGQLVKITTYPDTSTRIETYAKDGSLLKVTGSAVLPVRYDYGVESDGGVQRSYRKEIRLNTDGSDTSEWTKTYTDMLGRIYKTVYASASGSPATESFYNNKGQMVRQVDPDGVTTLYQYNEKGERTCTAIDMNANGQIDFDDTDRIMATFQDVNVDNAVSVNRTRTFVWSANGSSDSNLVSTTETSVDGLQNWNITWNNGAGLTNYSATVFTPDDGLAVTTSTAPDGSSSIVTNQYGRQISVTQKDANGLQLGQVVYGYDAHGRPITTTDARNGTATSFYNAADQLVATLTPMPDGIQAGQLTTNILDSMGRVIQTVLPDNSRVTNIYYPNGLLQQVSGSRTYPVAYTYDYAGRMKTMTTWTNFTTSSGAAVTTWNYDTYRGFLTSKTYADSQGPSYSYTSAGRLQTRVWTRGITTTYEYDDAGNLVSINYSDSTPSLTYGFDRLDRQATVTNGEAVCHRTYNDAGQMLSESYTGGILDGVDVTNGFDGLLRRTTLALASQPLTMVQYSYDAASRLNAVTNGSETVAYGYLANSPLVQSLTFKQGGTTRLTTTKSYDYLNRLTSISSSSSVFTQSFNYSYNSANLRSAVTNEDNSRWVYQYDALGQVTSGKKYWSDGMSVEGQQFDYTFDDIGNRRTTARDSRLATYANNELNQIDNRTVPGYLNILGSANSNATVTVWGTNYLYARATRHGDYFRMELPLNNTNSPLWLSLTNLAVLNNGTNSDIIASDVGKAYLAQTPESFTYDSDGNLTSDGHWTNTWDAENRLTCQMSLSTAPTESKYKVDYLYDYSGRMIQRIVSTNDGSQYVAFQTNRFVYDRNVQVAELNESNGLVKSYVRGLDLSGTTQGAGGTGGLLSIDAGSSGIHLYAMDGNGNVMALVNMTNGTASARYEYSPFGELLRASGSMAFLNSFGFSSQFTDYTTRRILYLYRPYDPPTGRWSSRDPMGEIGCINLYDAFFNSPLSFVDRNGADNYHIDPNHPTVLQNAVNSVTIPASQLPASIVNPIPLANPYQTDAAAFGFVIDLILPNPKQTCCEANKMFETGFDSQTPGYLKVSCVISGTSIIILGVTELVPGAGAVTKPLKKSLESKCEKEVEQLIAKEVREALTEADAKLYGRVSHPQGFREQVWETAKAPDGNVYDPTGRILKFDEPWELGHTPANKFSDAQLRAAQEGWDRQTWIRYQNDPAIYRPELPSSNASHKWE